MLYKQQNELFVVSVFSFEVILNLEVSALYISRQYIKILFLLKEKAFSFKFSLDFYGKWEIKFLGSLAQIDKQSLQFYFSHSWIRKEHISYLRNSMIFLFVSYLTEKNIIYLVLYISH